MRLFILSLLMLFITGYSCTDVANTNTDNNNGPAVTTYEVVEAFPELTFEEPVDLQHPGDGTDRIFVVEKRGVIKVFDNDSSASSPTTFLDIQGEVLDDGNEQGLLGLAFHPDFETNGYFYVNYTNDTPLNGAPAKTIICRFKVSEDDPNKADPSSATLILDYGQPYENHNSGQLAFGPDGYLYIAAGDGGSSGDPDGNGQNRKTYLGNILRVDVDGMMHGNNYAIPSDNPYAGNEEGYRQEIYAYGFRNPWRFSFDPVTDELWAADVGQENYEEIDIVTNGGNYGWNIIEGEHCFESSDCETSGLKMPLLEYNHSDGNASVTGGYVYRGSSLPELTGKYVYADYTSGKIWALDNADPANPSNSEIADTDLSISSFGLDMDSELYMCDVDGKIYKFQTETSSDS